MFGWPVLLVLLEPLAVEYVALHASAIVQHALVGIYDQTLLVKPVLVVDQLLKLFLSLPLKLIALSIDLLLEFPDIDAAFGAHHLELPSESLQVLLYGLDGLLCLVAHFWLPILLIIVREISCVEEVVLDGVLVGGEGLQVMRSDEPFLLGVFARQVLDDVLLIVVGREVQRI